MAVVIGAWVCAHSLAGAALPEALPISAVAKGQRGVGKTVVAGTTVEEFAVEVLGVVEGQGPSGALILVQASGPLIERAGGIAAGMSGSPVYVDGRLLGALAFGFDMADHTLGLVTPVADMMKVHELTHPPAKGVTVGGRRLDGVLLAPNPQVAGVWRDKVAPEVAVAVPVATPLLVSGLGSRTRSALHAAAQRWHMLAVPAGTAPAGAQMSALEPGSSFGVQLVRGDINLTALGTVTFLGDGSFTGFGHPFLNRGEVSYFVTGAYIHEVVQSISVPFKIGSPLLVVGELTQDRGSAVAGILGVPPDSMVLQVSVRDRSLQRDSQLRAEVVHDEVLTVPLTAVALLEALDRAIDRIGRGTARVKVTLEGGGLAEPIVRDNVFFSATDISAAALGELLLGLQRVQNNEFVPVRPKVVTLQAEISDERETARIERANPKVRQAAPGDTVEIEVVLRPFRQEPTARTISLAIPANTNPGEVVVTVRGGGYGAPRLAAGELAAQLGAGGPTDEEEEDLGAPSAAASLSNFLENLFESDHNYDIVAEFYPMPEAEMMFDEAEMGNGELGYGLTLGGPKSSSKQQSKPQKEESWLFAQELPPVKASLATPFYIQGSASFPLQIVLPAASD